MSFTQATSFYLGGNKHSDCIRISQPIHILSSARHPSLASLWSDRDSYQVNVSEV